MKALPSPVSKFKTLLLSVFFLSAALFNCSTPYENLSDKNINKHTRVHSKLENPKGNITLSISNQSYDIGNVDIKVMIDSMLVVDDKFKVRDQHNWYLYGFSLSKGRHVFEAVTNKGRASIKKVIEIDTTLHACLNFWHKKDKSGDTLLNRKLMLELSNRPFVFF